MPCPRAVAGSTPSPNPHHKTNLKPVDHPCARDVTSASSSFPVKSYWPAELPPVDKCNLKQRPHISIIVQLIGLFNYLEPRNSRLTRELLPAARSGPLFANNGPPPKPWYGTSCLIAPAPEHSYAVALASIRLQLRGIFISASSDPQPPTALAPFALWQQTIASECELGLAVATAFDATGTSQNCSAKRSRRLSAITNQPLQPLPNWPDNGVDICPPVCHMAPVLKPPATAQHAVTLPKPNHKPSRLQNIVLRALRQPHVRSPNAAPKPSPPASPFNIVAFAQLLETAPFPHDDVTEAFLSLIEEGSGQVDDAHPDHFICPPNMPSLKGHEQAIIDTAMENVQLGLAAGPWSEDELPWPSDQQPNVQPQYLMAVGAVFRGTIWRRAAELIEASPSFVKPQGWDKYTGRGKVRIVNNGSSLRGTGWSLNDFSTDSKVHLNYSHVGELVQQVARFGRNTLYIIFDIKRAYKTLSLKPNVLQYYMFRVCNPNDHQWQYFQDLVQVFGTVDAEGSFQVFMAIFMHLFKHLPNHEKLRHAFHYVDNVYTPVPPTPDGLPDHLAAQQTETTIFDFLRTVGFEPNGDFDSPKSTNVNAAFTHEHEIALRFECLGWVMDTSIPALLFKPFRARATGSSPTGPLD